MIQKFARIILIGATLTAAMNLQAQPEESDIMQLIADMADKPENHAAIARYYQAQAEEARAEAELHKEMKETYSHSHAVMKGGAAPAVTSAHCDRLIELSLEAAEEFEALAAAHAQ